MIYSVFDFVIPVSLLIVDAGLVWFSTEDLRALLWLPTVAIATLLLLFHAFVCIFATPPPTDVANAWAHVIATQASVCWLGGLFLRAVPWLGLELIAWSAVHTFAAGFLAIWALLVLCAYQIPAPAQTESRAPHKWSWVGWELGWSLPIVVTTFLIARFCLESACQVSQLTSSRLFWITATVQLAVLCGRLYEHLQSRPFLCVGMGVDIISSSMLLICFSAFLIFLLAQTDKTSDLEAHPKLILATGLVMSLVLTRLGANAWIRYIDL